MKKIQRTLRNQELEGLLDKAVEKIPAELPNRLHQRR
jgi:hypothetical protein